MPSSNKILVIILTAWFVFGVNSWKTCQQVQFCDTIRNYKSDNPYTLSVASLIIENNVLKATLTGPNSLMLYLTSLQDDTYRIVIDEETQSTPSRHRVVVALDGEPEVVPLIHETLDERIYITNGDSVAVIHSSPFKIEFFNGERLVSVINEQGKLIYTTSIGLDISFPEAQRAYGLPEHAERLSLQSTTDKEPYRHFNVDYGAYRIISTESLYGSIPVLYAHAVTHSSGIFWMNSAQTWVDISASPNQVDALFMSESGLLEMFIMTGPTLSATVRQYAKLTGKAPLPPYFALGFHQSRYSYMTADEVRTVVNQFDVNKMPVDVLWLDIDYTDNIKYFTWDPQRFPTPIQLQNDLADTNRKLVAIIDPHFKKDDNYFVHREAVANNYYVKDSDGNDYFDDCWPGTSGWIDFTNPDALQYYSSLYTNTDTFQNPNIHIWNDMNEPAVFNGENEFEKTMPLDLVHSGGYLHRDVHNVYGMLQTIGTRKGMLERPERSNLRPFILTRSHFAGIQRYAAIWTGDNYASWEYLRISFPMCLTEALAGVSFCGADVGGFMGIPEDELYQRWFQAGAWLPFYRAHSTINVPRREPYRYSGLIQERLRNALNQRYAHLPVWYTLFYEHEITGDPVIRPLIYHYPADIDALSIDDQILIGSDILVAPIFEEGAVTRTTYLPGGENEVWYNIDENYLARHGTGRHLLNVTLNSVPVFYRGGSIIARKDIVKPTSTDTHQDPFTLYISLNIDGKARGTLYVDDYETFNYKSSSEFLYLELLYEENAFWTNIIAGNTNYNPQTIINKIIILNPPENVLGANLIGESNSNIKTEYSEDGVVLKISDFSKILQQQFRIELKISDAPEPVPTTWWKSCWDVGFCSRLRNNIPTNGYTLSMANLEEIEGHTIRMPLQNSQQTLTFELSTIFESTFRIVIDETTPSTPPRHRVPEALNGKPQAVQFMLIRNNDHVVVVHQDSKAIIYASPFKIEFYNGDRLLSIVNAQQKFAFELDRPNTGIALDVSFPGAERAYGLPSHAERLSLRSTTDQNPYRHFNSDYAAYQIISTESLYGSIPVLYGHATTHSSGVFWLNSAQTWVDIANSPNHVDALFVSESGALEMFIMTGPTLPKTIRQYSKLTGVAPLPPYFSLAYHQSRYSYMTQDEVKTVVDKFDQNAMPVDVIWLDIDYTEDKKYFTWDPVRFSDPVGLQKYLADTSRKLVQIIDPHIKVDDSYFVHQTAVQNNYYIRNPDGTNYVGDCWPGASGWLDFTNPQAVSYYASLYRDTPTFQAANVHIWNDMNEPAVFYDGDDYTYEKTAPLDVLHFNNYEHRDVHNVYGMLQTIGTRQGMLARSGRNNLRPFILTRSHFAGIQRYAAIWTGDNYASWEYLRISFPMCLTEALAGVSFCGADVGGFMGIPDDELYQRWFQAGAWLPFYRGHSTINVPRREPYRYSGLIQERLRNALNQRYAHLPVWYTLFYEHERTGEPVIRPITYHYETDVDVLSIDDQILVGNNILAAPILNRDEIIRQVYLPGGENEIWYNIDEDYEIYYGPGYRLLNVTLNSVPVFYKGGGIISRKDIPRPSSTLTTNDPYTLYVALDSNNEAKGTLYVDDFETFDYQNSNKYLYVQFLFTENKLVSSKIDTTSSYGGIAQVTKIVIINLPENVSSANFNQGEDLSANVTNSDDGRTVVIHGFTAKLQDSFILTLTTSSMPDGNGNNDNGDNSAATAQISIIMFIVLLVSVLYKF